MTDLLAAHDDAVAEFRRRLASVTKGLWTDLTPCYEWDVRALVEHVVLGNRFTADVLGGANAADTIARLRELPALEPKDALSAFDDSAEAASAAFGEDGALERECDHVIGPIPGSKVLELRVFDLTIHTWDLARAILGDEDIPAMLVSAALGIVDGLQRAGGPSTMGIVPVGRARPSDRALVRLLDLSGRIA